ncbi:MAG: DUF87 domain-containing protein [Candidatus Thorarchaeota archaeon]
MTTTLLVWSSFGVDPVEQEIRDGVFLLRKDNTTIGLCCFEIKSAGPPIGASEGMVQPSSAIRAIRNGLAGGVTVVYEFGVKRAEPFLRLFIAQTAEREADVIRTLKREATRIEAILMASYQNMELVLLTGNDLLDAIRAVAGTVADPESSGTMSLPKKLTIILLKGIPNLSVSGRPSQVGHLLSTLLRQGFDMTLTVVFSPGSVGKEKARMEREWRNIRNKERQKDDSLRDQTVKQKLIMDYQRVTDNGAWFDVSAYVTLESTGSGTLEASTEKIEGILGSTWAGDRPVTFKKMDMWGLSRYKVIARKHIKPQKVHVDSLATLVNIPIHSLPVRSASMPTFTLPAKRVTENELQIGWVVYEGRKLHRIGLKNEWLGEHVAVLGATGTGKTTLVRKLIVEISRKTNVPWWIFDVKGSEYSDLVEILGDEIVVLRPGLDPHFVIDLLDTKTESEVNTTLVMLKELLMERSVSSDLSPAMERLLREALVDLAGSERETSSVEALVEAVIRVSERSPGSALTRDALLNRLEILRQQPLGSILSGGKKAVSIARLLDKRVIFDLRHVARTGGMEAARILYNLVTKRIFDAAFRRGISRDLRHVVVLEEASNLVPESYTRTSAADVTTGESMVMLQRATGQGVIVVSTRPNISSNILANTAVRIMFRLPFDSSIGARYMSLDAEQERYLRSLKVGHALISLPGMETFEVIVDPVQKIAQAHSDDNVANESKEAVEHHKENQDNRSKVSGAVSSPGRDVTDLYRGKELVSQVMGIVARRGWATEDELYEGIARSYPTMSNEQCAQAIREAASLAGLEREPLPLIRGGTLYALPGTGLRAVRDAIAQYVEEKLERHIKLSRLDIEPLYSLCVAGRSAILVVGEQPKSSDLNGMFDRIRQHIRNHGQGISNLVVVVRGSVVAAKLREMMNRSDKYDNVEVIAAFPGSLDKAVEEIGRQYDIETRALEPEMLLVDNEDSIDNSRHGAREENPRWRAWSGLITGFVEISQGCARWEDVVGFIQTAAVRSRQARSIPLDAEEGRAVLAEMLADEELVALRTGEEIGKGISPGLWIANRQGLKEIKDRLLQNLEEGIKSRGHRVFRNHGLYDLCADGTSYLIFPTHLEISSLSSRRKDAACDLCHSSKIVCFLPATEYAEQIGDMPRCVVVKTMEESINAILDV